jgi:uncharacterized damage-inducible protein DinB
MQYQTLLDHWNEVRAGLYQAMGQLRDDQLSFTPQPGLWTLHQRLCHIATAEEGWFRYMALREISGWDEADFMPADYPSLSALRDLLERVHARTDAMFAAQPDLSSTMQRAISLPWGGETTMEWVTWHVIEHEIHHRGEIYLMLGLLGIEAPDV